jgi:hypothetical protein
MGAREGMKRKWLFSFSRKCKISLSLTTVLFSFFSFSVICCISEQGSRHCLDILWFVTGTSTLTSMVKAWEQFYWISIQYIHPQSSHGTLFSIPRHLRSQIIVRVLSFFSSRRNWDSPNPSPSSDVGTYTVVLFIYTYFVSKSNLPRL